MDLRNVLLKTYRILIEEFATIFKLYLLEEKERYGICFVFKSCVAKNAKV